jgi:hypothetical protein
MIKHGKVHPLSNRGRPVTHLDPIRKFVTKGIADARETIKLEPQACDMRGAKRFNSQQCVIAQAFKRTYRPQAVAIGRSLAYAVFNGLAVRFVVPISSRKVIKEFDERGRVQVAPITLCKVNPQWKLTVQRRGNAAKSSKKPSQPRHRMKKYGVRAIGGGVSA